MANELVVSRVHPPAEWSADPVPAPEPAILPTGSPSRPFGCSSSSRPIRVPSVAVRPLTTFRGIAAYPVTRGTYSVLAPVTLSGRGELTSVGCRCNTVLRLMTVRMLGRVPLMVCGTVVALGCMCAALAQEPAVIAQTPSAPITFPLRAMHAAGHWGTNEQVVARWNADQTEALVPADYLAWLKRLHVNWIGLSVALTYDDSMDSMVERDTASLENPSFSDEVLRQAIREFRAEGIDIYLTLAFEAHQAETAGRPVQRWQLGDSGDDEGGPCCDSGIQSEHWPWRPGHPDHQRFVGEFWETYTQHAVHIATLAEEEGVRMYSLGTETDRLFRTRTNEYFVNDFAPELRSMVDRVRTVYSGLLTYDMHYDAIINPDFYGPGSGAGQLWTDLGLDVVGISAWFPLADEPPATVISFEDARAAYGQIINEYLIPLAARNLGRPIMFLEYGAMDLIEAPSAPSDSKGFPPLVLADADGSGLDDGREVQAKMYQGMLSAMNIHPGVVNALFLWDNWIAGDELWAGYWANRRTFAVRDKLSESIVRGVYSRWASDGPPVAVGEIPSQTVTVGRLLPLQVNLASYFSDPESDALTYSALSSDPSVARVGTTWSILQIAADEDGEATVAVTATDGRGWATQTLEVTSVRP